MRLCTVKRAADCWMGGAMNWLSNATLVLQIVTALFVAGMIHSVIVKNWPMMFYYFFAAGLQVVVIYLGK